MIPPRTTLIGVYNDKPHGETRSEKHNNKLIQPKTQFLLVST